MTESEQNSLVKALIGLKGKLTESQRSTVIKSMYYAFDNMPSLFKFFELCGFEEQPSNDEAKKVAKLREYVNLGLMECKIILMKNKWDVDAAIKEAINNLKNKRGT